MVGKKARISDIADRVGVSAATVSRALSGKGYVRAELARDIRAAARDLEYAASGNFHGKQIILATSNEALIDLQRSQFTMHVVEGLRKRAASLGIAITVLRYDTKSLIKSLRQVPDVKDTIGALVLTAADELLDPLAELSTPLVLINSDDPLGRLTSVAPANRSAGHIAAHHLRELSHNRIAFLTKPGRRTIERRVEGLRDALGDLYDPALLIEAKDWTAEAGRDALAQALARGFDATAIVAAGDVLAAGAMIALQQAGFHVPRDFAVVGIDGLPQSEFLAPGLTSVAIPMRAVGALSVDMLCRTAEREQTSPEFPARRVELGCELIVRGSSVPGASPA